MIIVETKNPTDGFDAEIQNKDQRHLWKTNAIFNSRYLANDWEKLRILKFWEKNSFINKVKS